MQLVCATCIFLTALVVYARTLAPTVTFVDSGELIVAAKNLGVAHPPGTPLYVLLAHLFTLLPVGNVATRVNLASAVFAALAAAATCLLVIEIQRRTTNQARLAHAKDRKDELGTKKRAAGRQGRAEPADNSPADPATLANAFSPTRVASEFAPAVIAGLLLTFSRTLWSFATVAEVYTLNTLLVVIIFLLVFRWLRLGSMRLLYTAAFIFGLALGVHHVTVAVILPALALSVLRSEGLRFFKSKRLIYAALISCAGLLLIYSYLPIAAARSPIMNWGDPRTLQRIWWHVSGRQYQVFLSFSVEQMVRQASMFGRLAAREFGPAWLPIGFVLATLGVVDSFRRDRTLCYFLLLIIVADLTYALNYEIAEDKGAYYLPTFLAVTIAAGLGTRWLINLAAKHRRRRGLVYLSILFATLAPLLALSGNFPVSDRHRYFLAPDYIHNIESTIAPDGMLLTSDWQVYSPLLYLHEVENQRRDIIAINLNLLRRSWYFDNLERQYPQFINQNRAVVSAFLEDLRSWENDPARYARNAALTERINSRFYEMIEAFIRSRDGSAPVYVTLDVALGAGDDAQLVRWMQTNYQPVPQGLVFQLTEERSFVPPANINLVTRGLADDTVRFDLDDVVAQKVLPTYVKMLYNRGVYLGAHAREAEAVASYRQALMLDPNNSLIRQALAAREQTR